ncbi:MAG TPA: CUAEP/CCAEP-tail radical SAM protein [Candidatus Angelobacter sp.]|nr:CUAEP/CCAEP-tail radical SAM protein [Candidatus Angelobacter sp.]
MKSVLISTYELGRQPFGLASPAAWLRRAGSAVTCLDLSCQALDEEAVRSADLIAIYIPMHTATRLAAQILPAIQKLNPRGHLCCYGLYAPMNEAFLRKLGVQTILGGEFEEGLVATMEQLRNPSLPPGSQPRPAISLARQNFLVPDRKSLPPLNRYAKLILSDGTFRIAGYTEASRGCKHRCRHCPIVPVYDGVFRVVQPEVVLEDIRRQVAMGAGHVTFGDPDFFNGIRHAVRIVTALHTEHPTLTYDVTIKVEHLLKHAEFLPTLRDTGCAFVTSAVESLDDEILCRLDKGHTYRDFVRVLELCRQANLPLSPTFVAFTPWTTLQSYCRSIATLQQLGLSDHVAPIQHGIRLLIPAGSRLMELAEISQTVGPFDERALAYPWSNPDPRVDELCARVQGVVHESEKVKASRRQIFHRVSAMACEAAGIEPIGAFEPDDRLDRAAMPYLTEPWYC